MDDDQQSLSWDLALKINVVLGWILDPRTTTRACAARGSSRPGRGSTGPAPAAGRDGSHTTVPD